MPGSLQGGQERAGQHVHDAAQIGLLPAARAASACLVAASVLVAQRMLAWPAPISARAQRETCHPPLPRRRECVRIFACVCRTVLPPSPLSVLLLSVLTACIARNVPVRSLARAVVLLATPSFPRPTPAGCTARSSARALWHGRR